MNTTLDTRKFVSILKGIVEDGHEVSMTIVGSSMSPFLIHNRDKIYFTKPDSPLKRGDMVFYQRSNGQYVMHRIINAKKDGYYMVGDAQIKIEGPIDENQIFAIVTKVVRKGKTILPGNFWWKFFSGPWLTLLPLRPMITKLYGIKNRQMA